MALKRRLNNRLTDEWILLHLGLAPKLFSRYFRNFRIAKYLLISLLKTETALGLWMHIYMYVNADICTYLCILHRSFRPLNAPPISLHTTKGFEIRCFQIVSFSIKRLLQILKTISWVLESFLKIRLSPPPGYVCKKDASTRSWAKDLPHGSKTAQPQGQCGSKKKYWCRFFPQSPAAFIIVIQLSEADA